MALFPCLQGGGGGSVAYTTYSASASAPYGQRTTLTATVTIPDGATACGLTIDSPGSAQYAAFGGYQFADFTQNGTTVTINANFYNVASAQQTTTARISGKLYYV